MRLKGVNEKEFAVHMAVIITIVALAFICIVANDTYQILDYHRAASNIQCVNI